MYAYGPALLHLSQRLLPSNPHLPSTTTVRRNVPQYALCPRRTFLSWLCYCAVILTIYPKPGRGSHRWFPNVSRVMSPWSYWWPPRSFLPSMWFPICRRVRRGFGSAPSTAVVGDSVPTLVCRIGQCMLTRPVHSRIFWCRMAAVNHIVRV